MKWIDDAMDSDFSLLFFLVFILAGVMALLGVFYTIEQFVPKRQSTGVVVMQTQTARRDGTPEYYLYIRDDSTGVTMEKSVSGGMYVYCPKGRKLSYVMHNECSPHDIKLMY